MEGRPFHHQDTQPQGQGLLHRASTTRSTWARLRSEVMPATSSEVFRDRIRLQK